MFSNNFVVFDNFVGFKSIDNCTCLMFSGDFQQFRRLIADNPEPLARNFCEKLITYGTGSDIQFADRREIKKIVEQTADSNYGMRSLLHAAIASDIFLSK